MAVFLSLFAGAGQQFFTNAGVPLAGGKIFTYGAGGSTPQATYTTSAGNIAHSNPIVLDAAGRVPGGGEIWLTSNLAYKFVLQTSASVTVQTLDNVGGGVDGASLSASSGSSLVGFIQSQSGAVARTVQGKLRDSVSVKDFGAIGDGVTDDTAAIQSALSSGATSIYLPDGTYGVKAINAALTLSASDTRFDGPGYLIPLANASGWAPQQMLIVSGNRNIININVWNSSDLGKRSSDASNEYPMDGIRVTGSENTIETCCVFNFVTPIVIRGGTGNKVLNSRVTTKQVSNLAWPNDGILWFQTTNGVCFGNECGLAVTAAQRTVIMSGVTGASTSLLRTGITIDADTDSIVVEANHVGEGYIAGIHSEGTGNRRHTIANNFIYKQKRNGINAAGQRLTIIGNRCFGTFNTDTTAGLTGIIGSVDGLAIIVGNVLECNTNAVEGIRMLANSQDVIVESNIFEGTFKYCVTGIANNVSVISNTLRGSAIRFASLDKPVAIAGDVFAAIESNFVNGITGQFAILGSGLAGIIANNKICLSEGYVAADGVIEFGGDYGLIAPNSKLHIMENDCIYVGTTPVTGTKSFIKSSASSGSSLRGIIRDNSFDSAIFNSLATGSFIAGDTFFVSGNSTDFSTAINQRYGSFTLSASATTTVANNSVSTTSVITLTPSNAAAATLMSGSKSLYVSARTGGTSFAVTTADGTSAAGTETFLYQIVA